MIDNAQALLLPIIIFVLFLIFIFITKLLKPKENLHKESTAEEDKYKKEWGYSKHNPKNKFYLLLGNTVGFLVFLFFATFLLNKIFPEVQIFEDILSIYKMIDDF